MSQTSGIYRLGTVSGVMAAGLAAAAPVYSFQWSPDTPGLLAAVKRVIISAGNASTAFAAGVCSFSLVPARPYKTNDTGGTVVGATGNIGAVGRLRSAYPNSQVNDIRIASTAALTAGTRTLDGTPLASITSSTPAVAGQSILTNADLFLGDTGQFEFVLKANEGFEIQATVPATGTWQFSVTTVWEEATGF